MIFGLSYFQLGLLTMCFLWLLIIIFYKKQTVKAVIQLRDREDFPILATLGVCAGISLLYFLLWPFAIWPIIYFITNINALTDETEDF